MKKSIKAKLFLDPKNPRADDLRFDLRGHLEVEIEVRLG